MRTGTDPFRFGPGAEVQDIVAASGSSFTTAMKILPRDRREAMFAIYAFCRLVDDITDGQGPASEKLVGLNEWSNEIARTYQRTPSTAVGEELARAIERFQLPRREFDLILVGMRMDVEGMVAPHPMRLARYVRCVAGTVGLLSMRVFGAWQGDASRRFALSLASAMQLTNILRDVEEDARLGRLYIPESMLAATGVPLDPHTAWQHPSIPEARRCLGLVARAQFHHAWMARRGHVRARLIPALLMMGPYERLLASMEADWARPPLPRSGWRKMTDGVVCAVEGFGSTREELPARR
jgi:presqualene diphosphate synthase